MVHPAFMPKVVIDSAIVGEEQNVSYCLCPSPKPGLVSEPSAYHWLLSIISVIYVSTLSLVMTIVPVSIEAGEGFAPVF